MSGQRYTLFARSPQPLAADLRAILDAPDVVVLDQTGERAFLIEADARTARRLAELLPDWVVAPERHFPSA